MSRKSLSWLSVLLVTFVTSISANAATVTIYADGFETTLADRWVFFDPSDPENPLPDPGWGGAGSPIGLEGTHSGSSKAYSCGRGYLGSFNIPQYPSYMQSQMIRTNLDLRGFTSATLSFWYKVKIPDAFTVFPSALGGDGLNVYIDEDSSIFTTLDLEHQITNWTQVTISLNDFLDGVHSLAFEFFSDGDNPIFSASNNPDEWIDDDPEFGVEVKETDYEGVYIDDLLITGETDLKFQSVTTASQNVKLTLRGGAGVRYTVESSTDLTSWNLLTNVIATNTTFEVNSTLTNSARFYRFSAP